MEHLFCLRYELPQPTANQKHDITSWTEAVDNSMAQLEHQAERFVYIVSSGCKSNALFMYVQYVCIYVCSMYVLYVCNVSDYYY